MKSWFARHMPLNMPIRSLFVRATSFKFNGPMPNLSNGYGVVDRMGKKDGFIEVFCRNPAAMRPQSPIIQRENLPHPRGSGVDYFRCSMVGHWWNLKGVEWGGYQKEYCEFLTSNHAMEPTASRHTIKFI
jgi:hypothetical protein